MNRTRTRILGGAALVLTLAAGALGVHYASGPGTARTVAGARAPSSFHFAWVPGSEYLYALRWNSSETVHLELGGSDAHTATPVAGSVDVTAKLRLRAIAPRNDGWLLEAALIDIERAQVALGAQRIEGDAVREVLGGKTAQVEIGPDGHVRATFFDPEAPVLFKHLAQTLLGELSLDVPADTELTAGAAWDAKDETPLGVAESHYQVDDPARLTLLRTRAHYGSLRGVPDGASQAVEGRASIALDPAGHLRAYDTHETVTAARGSAKALESREDVSLALLAIGRFDATAVQPVSALEARHPGEVWGSPQLRKQMLEQRIDGLDEKQILASIALAGDGKIPDVERFLWRATGYISLHPEACRTVAAMVAHDGAKSGERAMALDLLASVGHRDAQAAMRTVLGAEAVKHDPDHVLLLQRLSLVKQPERATASFVGDSYAAASRSGASDERWASAYTLGAVASSLAAGGDDKAAHDAIAPVAADLARATTPDARAHLLTAFGSAGFAENVPTVLGYATSEDDEVRRAAAAAMYKTDTPEVRTALVTLVADHSPSVEATALGAMDHMQLGDDDVAALTARVLAGATHRRNDPMLVSLVATHLQWGAAARQMLEYMLARNGDDASLEARIKAVLAQVEGV